MKPEMVASLTRFRGREIEKLNKQAQPEQSRLRQIAGKAIQHYLDLIQAEEESSDSSTNRLSCVAEAVS